MGRRRRHGLGLLAALVASALAVAGCGGGAEDPGPLPPTTSPEAAAAGREVCAGFFADLEIVPRVERARQAGPRLGRIFEELARLRAQQDAGEVTGTVLLERVRTVVASLEIVCEDDYGVRPPPGYTRRSAGPG